jgi:hypothetical protein
MIKDMLCKLTGHIFVEITTRGNTAIEAAVSVVSGKVLIPAEGGWLSYKKIENHQEVKCHDSVLDIDDLKENLATKEFGALLYQNPGGYFAKQPMQEIYGLCKKYNCLVILDVSGSIGTDLCDGNYADIIVGSFGKWKLVEARVGGFVSCNDEALFGKMDIQKLEDEKSLLKIEEELSTLPQRIESLLHKTKTITEDLKEFDIVGGDVAFVVVVKFSTEEEKEKLINYCKNNELEWTECPRYIRLNDDAISIEVKRLQND